jgi:hypothetical protein
MWLARVHYVAKNGHPEKTQMPVGIHIRPLGKPLLTRRFLLFALLPFLFLLLLLLGR